MNAPIPYPFGAPGTCLLCPKGEPCDPEIHERYARFWATYTCRQGHRFARWRNWRGEVTWIFRKRWLRLRGMI